MAYSVLIVDDMLLNRKLIRRALEQRIDDIVLHEATDGEEALEIIYKNEIDTIILDLVMPKKDGFEVIEELKDQREYRDIPIIVNSAMDEGGTIEKALEMGAMDYFAKPLTMQQMEMVLPVKVKNALKSYEQTKLLLRMNHRMREELKFANALQTALIDEHQVFPNAELTGRYIPSAELSGDFFECLQVDDRVWILMADVSGHGAAAAMISSMIKVMFKDIVSRHGDPGEVFKDMNNTFYDLTRGTYYITAFLGLMEGDKLIYSNGGHPYPIMIDTKENKAYMLEDNGFIIGIMEDYEYRVHSVNMNPGDYIIMYTDGLLETEESGEIPRSCEDILEYTKNNIHLIREGPNILLDTMLKDLGKDTADRLKDDVALIAVEKK